MKLKTRRTFAVVTSCLVVVLWLILNPGSYETIFAPEDTGAESEASHSAEKTDDEAQRLAGKEDDGVQYSAGKTDEVANGEKLAVEVLEHLKVKGRAPKTGYSREQFYNGWPDVDGCSLRQKIIRREFGESAVMNGCDVIAGEYDEPYTGEHKVFTERSQISKGVQIDHVVALSDAWQKGAQNVSSDTRYNIATDPLNLLAVDGGANQQKSDGDAATWLPKNKKFRCQYVARQVSVKYKYGLWVTQAEKEAILRILANCPSEIAIGV